MSNAGEQLTLTVDGEIVQQFAYDDAWHPATDGDGPSLELAIPPTSNRADWAVAASWRASAMPGGTPGKAGTVIGDSNHDGVFDSSDLVKVFQAAKYEDMIPNNATFEEGDWNGDGDFDTRDFIFAFSLGDYEQPPPVVALDQLRPLAHIRISRFADNIAAASDEEVLDQTRRK